MADATEIGVADATKMGVANARVANATRSIRDGDKRESEEKSKAASKLS